MLYEEGHFTTHDGLSLYVQRWLPEDTPKANLAVVHGLGEYSGRYANFAEWFVPQAFAVHSFDLRGHGKSPGQRGHINAWHEFREDVPIFLDNVKQHGSELPTFLIGHSLGALIVLDYVLHGAEALRGVVASGPPLDWGPSVAGWRIMASRILARLSPKMQMPTGLRAEDLSHDPAVVEGYRNDPLVHGHSTPRFGTELDQTMRRTMAHADDWPPDLPLLMIHGGADPICPPAASARFFANVSAQDKVRHEYPDYLHESLNEVGREKVLADIQTWLEAHL